MPNYQKVTPKAVFQLAGPNTWLPASIIPVFFAGILALRQEAFSASMFYILLCAALLMQSAVNSLNDYYDFIRGTDSIENTPENDDTVLVLNSFDPAKARLIGIGFLLAALALGVYVVVKTNYIPLIIGIIGTVTVIAYSAGPHPLSYMPLGEFTSGVVMGILLPMAVYAALAGEMAWRLLYYCLPLTMGIAMVMMTNNTCDIERDSAAGRKTLPILLGRKSAASLHHILMAAWMLLIAVILFGHFNAGLFVLPLGLIGGGATIIKICTATFYPPNRGQHMLDIYKANLWINGTYTLCVLVGLLRAL